MVGEDARPLPYGLTWWLDTVTDGHWDALVVDDYRLVLPLPDLRRARIVPAIISPAYTQQLGPYGTVTDEAITSLLRAVPQRVQIALPIRPDVNPAAIPARYRYRRRINYVVDLSVPMPQVVKGFPKTLQSLLRKSGSDSLERFSPEHHADLNRKLLGGRKGINVKHFSVLERLMLEVERRGFGACYQLREDGELLAAGFFPRFGGRTINLAPVSTELGRKRRGMSRLLALVMARDAGCPGSRFDFEGSELPGVKEYFAKFGGEDEGYLLVEQKAFGLL